jgi:hypothetical protein
MLRQQQKHDKATFFQESSGSLGNSLQASLMRFATLLSSVCHVHENCHVRDLLAAIFSERQIGS